MSRRRHDDDRTVSFDDVLAVAQTDKALCVRIAGEDVWIPQSQIHEDSEVYQKDDTGTLVITKWIAEQKGLG